LVGGVPASLTLAGKATTYAFKALQTVDVVARNRVVLDLCWRAIRDGYYDERLGNRDWSTIRAKYLDAAGQAPDMETLITVVHLMLGELNGSHLGFGPWLPPGPVEENRWKTVTPHLGLRFDADFVGPGLKIRDVIPDGPADRQRSRLVPGDVVLAIDGVNLTPDKDLTEIINGPLERDISLRVRSAAGVERIVVLRPISYPAAQALLYEKWIDDNQHLVAKLSGGKLGYLSVRGMDWASFNRLEEELCSVGSGKDGIVIDVRENGGGFTADHLLTVLCQPRHAITVPRGGGPGYPGDRLVYGAWQKPIVVLCNQNSFSNAEIFSHAVKLLGRGQVVGVPTAGGVISTGSTAIMDFGVLRMPFRGWYDAETGEDMELLGAVPDHILWPDPADEAAGVDRQLEKSVAVLLQEVKADQAKPRPKLKKASQRRR